MLKAHFGQNMAVCRLWVAVVCVVLLCFSMGIVGSVLTTCLHSPVSLIQYASTILKLLGPNRHEFFPSPASPPPNIFFQRRRRGKTGGVEAKHDKRPYRPFMPSVMTGNVRSLNNKINELSSLSKVHNNKWCHKNNTHQVKKEASKDVELLTLSLRPFYLPGEFTNVYVTTIYTPPDSNVENANNIINKRVNDLLTKSPDCILTDDFNNSRDINIPELLQYVNCLTRGHATLDLFFLQCQGRLYLCPTGAHRQV